MKQIAAVTIFSLLTGVHTIYIAGNDFSMKRDITRALKSELPDVRVVPRASEADVVMELGGIPARTVRTRPTYILEQQPHISSVGPAGVRQSVTTVVRINPEASLQTHTIGTMTGVIRRGNDAVVLYEGMPTPFFATQFAAKFIKAWRDANR